MAQINKPNTHFNTKLYTGNGSTQSITGVGFQPDWIWFKVRSEVGSSRLVDVVRGNTKYLFSNATDAEATASTNVTSFDSDGFSLGSGSVNEISRTYASWNWLAGGTAISNTDGSITSSVSANTTAGFSIGKTTGTLSSGDITVGHGLGTSNIGMVLWKRTDGVSNWQVYHKSLGSGLLQLNSTGTVSTGSAFWGTPTSTTFQVNSPLYGAGETYVYYCFAEVKGYSKFGSYTGNGSTNGPFVYTGFKPAFIITRPIGNVSSWNVTDVKRSTYNDGSLERFKVNLSDGESSSPNYDILSNGFKIRTTDNDYNPTGFAVNKVIYMAFAENPLVGTNNIPATAR